MKNVPDRGKDWGLLSTIIEFDGIYKDRLYIISQNYGIR